MLSNDLFYCANVILNGFPGGFFMLWQYLKHFALFLSIYCALVRVLDYCLLSSKYLACIDVTDFNFAYFVVLMMILARGQSDIQ